MTNEKLHAVHLTSREMEVMLAWLTEAYEHASASEAMQKSTWLSGLRDVITKTRQAYSASLSVENKSDPFSGAEADELSPGMIAAFSEKLKEYAYEFPKGASFTSPFDNAVNYRDEIKKVAKDLERVSRWYPVDALPF